MPIISYREVIAAWALIVLVAAALFGSDFLWRDAGSAAACRPRVVAPESRVFSPAGAYDRGERLDRLDWDRDINAGGAQARTHVPRPLPASNCPL